ncbi:DNA alkylation repair protein [Albimonas sp. CAU 1670]|uniref:DNA alkylation repair protein n=1 Tax=Albimonas sp. CAU 1670 TaxID=3032599 RepID=UPI0023DBBC87|nr:DNA alkylation repair protein [Albimonas sp. CAU 1670]MDF2233419.1 DNA alkylation repair protein [Albimonas sp. CAU 1670]
MTETGSPDPAAPAPVSPERAMAELRALADPERAAKMAAYHKTEREVLGLAVPQATELADAWRAEDPTVAGRVALAGALWDTGVFEARIAAAKLLTQARIRGEGPEGDRPVWELIASWVPQFDGWALADHAADAGARRLAADPSRLDEVEPWTRSEHLWTRRAAMVFTLPWAKMRHPSPEDLARRERILGWAADYAADRDWFIQKSVSWWLRTLSTRDPARVQAFLDAHGAAMKPFARRDALRRMG